MSQLSQTSKESLQFKTAFLHPRFWGIWLGYALLRLIGFLPYTAKIRFGEAIGSLLYKLAGSRRRLARTNLNLAFPEKSKDEIQQLLLEHFKSLGVGLIEITVTAWGKHRRNEQDNECAFFSYVGLENLEQHSEEGVLLLVPHFTSMEMSGLMLSFVTPFRPIYRKHDNPLLEYLITKSRSPGKSQMKSERSVAPLLNTDTKTMLKALRDHQRLWIAPDQKYTDKGSLYVPFFDVMAPSNPGITKLAKLGKAKVIPCFTRRNGPYYEMHIHPALENFPTGDDYQDILRLHHLYEAEIRQNPSQYLWVHDRWDTRNHNPHIPQDRLDTHH